MVLDDEITLSDTPSTPLEHFLAEAVAGLTRREQVCRRGHPAHELQGTNVILVDCGIRTGSTMKAALTAIRTLNPRKIVAAVPVASTEGIATTETLADEFVCLARPQTFVNAAFWYRDFTRPADEDVGNFLSSNAGC